MRELTSEGQKTLAEIAQRHGFSAEAARVMLDALSRGGGSMAQFSHAEFGGSGQWLQGGMTMIGDMFNNSLKARVDALCGELVQLLGDVRRADTVFTQSQSQSQSPGGQSQSQGWPPASGGSPETFASYSSQSAGDWWPADLGSPGSVGSQNDMRYAYFPQKRRLAIYRGGRVEVLDTGEHMIHGFGQQQGGSDSITLTSQLGTVALNSLKRVESASPSESAKPTPFAGTGPGATPAAGAAESTEPRDSASVLALLEKLGELKEKGVLSAEEFAAKKEELLKRL